MASGFVRSLHHNRNGQLYTGFMEISLWSWIVRTHTHTCTSMCNYTHTQTHMRMHTYAHTDTTYLRMQTQTETYALMHTYTHNVDQKTPLPKISVTPGNCHYTEVVISGTENLSFPKRKINLHGAYSNVLIYIFRYCQQ